MIQTLRVAQTPALEKLRVHYGRYDLRADTILCGKADRLRHVELSRFYIPWNTEILRGLVSLKLEDFREGPTADQLIDILSASPGLTTLHLDYLTVRDRRTNVTSREAGSLELPALRTLRISRLSPSLERAVILAIKFQGRTNLNLNADLHATAGFLQDSSVADFTSFFKTSVASPKELIVVWISTKINFELRTSTGCLVSLSVPRNWDSASPDGLVDALQGTGSLHSQFVIKGDSSFRGIAPLLQPKSRFTSIKLDGVSESLTTYLMRFFATPIATDNTWGWPVPDLEELQVLGVSEAALESVTKMVASRGKGQGARGENGALIEPALKACPLLRFWSQSDHPLGSCHFLRLREMLGEANVLHEGAIQGHNSDDDNNDNGHGTNEAAEDQDEGNTST
ncbi:hypothetical protein FRB94_002416 [Tulasnella sp. JGI-2019a]|nr:hypothetical protein FRB94_002416 [Tulasnella sp. JGI-2019a]